MLMTPAGWATTRLVEILCPFLLASVFFYIRGKGYLIVITDAVEELDSGSRQLQVLNANVNPLGDNSLSDLLVDDDSDGSGVDVEDGTSSTVVVLVGHALVDGAIYDDVDDVSELEAGEGIGDVNGSVLLESFSEFMSGSSFVSVAVSHFTMVKK
jgi:hypothetical protein